MGKCQADRKGEVAQKGAISTQGRFAPPTLVPPPQNIWQFLGDIFGCLMGSSGGGLEGSNATKYPARTGQQECSPRNVSSTEAKKPCLQDRSSLRTVFTTHSFLGSKNRK